MSEETWQMAGRWLTLAGGAVFVLGLGLGLFFMTADALIDLRDKWRRK